MSNPRYIPMKKPGITDMTLTELGIYYETDKAYYHGFTPFYEIALEHLRLKHMNILEIGAAGGESLKMWKHYFRYSNIYGFGIDGHPELSEERMRLSTGDQSDRDFLSNTYQMLGTKRNLDMSNNELMHELILDEFIINELMNYSMN
mgnify:CR=1 FL=1